MNILKKGKSSDNTVLVQTAGRNGASMLDFGINPCEKGLYDALRHKVPVIDAALSKIVRLTGAYKVTCNDERFQYALDCFCEDVPVGLTGKSLSAFTDSYLDSLLTYGNAAGEILVNSDSMKIAGLYNGDVGNIEVCRGISPVDRKYFVIDTDGKRFPVQNPKLILFTALNPPCGKTYGVSILRGLPALSSVLLRIYECIGQNYDRIGNVRYAVTYKPTQDSAAFAKERATQIAGEWSAGMNSGRNGEIRDFIAVGDVDIKVIGAENQLADTNIPVRQLLEQIVSKLSIPPFLLGLNWSSTERMSSQQCDILTSELEYYRRLISPVIKQICTAFLRLSGSTSDVMIEWENINLQDEEKLAMARLNTAKAKQIEKTLE